MAELIQPPNGRAPAIRSLQQGQAFSSLPDLPETGDIIIRPAQNGVSLEVWQWQPMHGAIGGHEFIPHDYVRITDFGPEAEAARREYEGRQLGAQIREVYDVPARVGSDEVGDDAVTTIEIDTLNQAQERMRDTLNGLSQSVRQAVAEALGGTNWQRRQRVDLMGLSSLVTPEDHEELSKPDDPPPKKQPLPFSKKRVMDL